MINEAEKLDSIFNKVKTFVNFAKNAKTENEKEQLMSDAGDIKKEIQNSNVDNNLTQILLSTIVAAVLFLNTSGNAKESPNISAINSRITTGIEKAEEILGRFKSFAAGMKADVEDVANAKIKNGVIGKGKLVDGNNFLEYADGAKLVYRADLGKENQSTYFEPNSKYKGMSWDDAITYVMPVDSPVADEEDETKEQPEPEEEIDQNLEEALLVLKKHNFTATKNLV
jgi:hypothetical protein